MAKLSALLFVILTTFAFSKGQNYNYSEVLEKSLLFYEAERSGRLGDDNRIAWRGHSMLEDGAVDGVDLTGGYHNCGDHVKFNFPQAWAITTIAYGALEFKEGYISAGQWEHVLNAVKWGADYYLKCHTGETELYVQVGDGNADHQWWDMPERWTDARPVFKVTAERPGSDIAGETSALFSAGSILFRGINDTFADLLVEHAKSLYNFGYQYRGKYSDAVPETFFPSDGFGDELAWAAAWLYRATLDDEYLLQAQDLYVEFNLTLRSGYDWNLKFSGVDLLLYQITGSDGYRNKIVSFCDNVVDQLPRTPKGLVIAEGWSILRGANNAMFVCVQAAQLGINSDKYMNFAKSQIGLILGDWGRSFVTGFGFNPPTRVHHRAASCPSPPAPCGWPMLDSINPNPHVLNGALVGGPTPDDQWEDSRQPNDGRNEVCLDFQAAFQGVIAAMQQTA